MKNFTFVHESPSHFILHNGKSHFHIAKNGIDEPTATKIRALANGGRTTAGDITQKENQKNMHKIDANIAAAKNYSSGGPTQSPEEAGIEAEEKTRRAQSKQSPEEKQIESQAKNPQDPIDYVKYNNPDKFADGGPATNEDPVQSFQDSFRKATHYYNGTDDVQQAGPPQATSSPDPEPTPTNPISAAMEDYNKHQHIIPKKAQGGSVHHTQGKYHFHFYDGGPVTHSDKQPDAPPTPLDNYVNQVEPTGTVGEDAAAQGVQLNSKDLDPNAQLSLPNAQLPETPLQQEMDKASQPAEPPSAQESANNIARTMGKDLPFPHYTDTTSPDQAQAPTPGAIPPSQQISMAAKPSSGSPIPDKSDMLTQLNADIKGEQDAILGGKTEEAKGFTAQAKAIQSNLDQQQVANDAYKQESDLLTMQNEKLFQSVRDDKIQPKTFWNIPTTGGKIAAGIALLLGGISSGYTGKSNPALDMLQKTIQNDIEAQKANQQQGVNLYKLGLEKYRDTQSAHQYATLQANAILQGQLSKIAARTGSQTAQFQAQQAIHQLGLQNAELRSNLGLRQAAIQSMNAQPTSGGGIDLNKSRLLTMAGIIPKEEQSNVDKESDDYQKLSTTLDHTDQVFKQAANTANYTQRAASALPGGSMLPTFRDSTKEYNAITDAWLGNITKDTEGRVTPTDVDLMRKSLPIAGDPPALIQTKLNNIKDMIRQKYSFNTILKNKLISPTDPVITSNATRQKRFTEGPVK